MKKKLFYVLMVAIAGVGLLAGNTMTSPISEPATMLFFGSGLVGIAGIIKKKGE